MPELLTVKGSVMDYAATSRPNSHEWQMLLAQDIPIIDVRAPVEFAQGAMPAAINLPLMNDQERIDVGICYKQSGQQAALNLGHQRVSGETRTARLNAWREACLRYPNGYLSCARGGLRSRIVQQWLHDAGIDYPRVEGGYKQLRQAAIQVINTLSLLPIVLVGGFTGSGKTQLIKAQPLGVDLEGLAHHRGSSFGRTLSPQLSQASFENALAATLLRKHLTWHAHAGAFWLLEDEGQMIGSNHLPHSVREQMSYAPVAVVEEPFPRRLERLRSEYFIDMQQAFCTTIGEEQGWLAYGEYLHHGLFAIRRRLGQERYTALAERQRIALDAQQRSGDTDGHFAWLVPLLENYYDPMYRYQLEKKAAKICFRGDYYSVEAWLTDRRINATER